MESSMCICKWLYNSKKRSIGYDFLSLKLLNSFTIKITFMKYLLGVLLMLSTSTQIFAQNEDKIKWTNELRTYGKNEYEVVMTANLQNGWYIFSQNSDSSSNGAKPTKVRFDNNPNIFYEGSIIIFDGKVEEDGQPVETSDNSKKLIYYKDKISFIQGVNAKEKHSKVSGVIQFTISDGNTYKTLDEAFSFQL
jgi:hypothetical protein